MSKLKKCNKKDKFIKSLYLKSGNRSFNDIMDKGNSVC